MLWSFRGFRVFRGFRGLCDVFLRPIGAAAGHGRFGHLGKYARADPPPPRPPGGAPVGGRPPPRVKACVTVISYERPNYRVGGQKSLLTCFTPPGHTSPDV